MMVFRCRSAVSSKFIMWQLNAPHVLVQASNDVAGATAPHVNVETIRNYVLLIPPLGEQQLICDVLEAETARVERLALRIKREINLIQEYRRRLISDVVTGKLDIRYSATSELASWGIGR
jgi:type I restriction enzyme S subunit